MLRVCLKLRRLEPILKALNKKCYSNISQRVIDAKNELIRLQECCSYSPVDPSNVLLEREALHKYIDLSNAEESFKRPKSRVRWLNLGDQNTFFFHRRMTVNRMRNKILSICDENGQKFDEVSDVKRVIVDFYVKLSRTKFAQRIQGHSNMHTLIEPEVPENLKGSLIMAVSADEVKRAIYSIKGDKAPRPDGLNSAFFQQNWEVVRSNVILAAHSVANMLNLMNIYSLSAPILVLFGQK